MGPNPFSHRTAVQSGDAGPVAPQGTPPDLRRGGRRGHELHDPGSRAGVRAGGVRALVGGRRPDRHGVLRGRRDHDAGRRRHRRSDRPARRRHARVPAGDDRGPRGRPAGPELPGAAGLAHRGRPGLGLRLRRRRRVHDLDLRRPRPPPCPGPLRGVVPARLGHHPRLHPGPGRAVRRLAPRLHAIGPGRRRRLGRVDAPRPGRRAGPRRDASAGRARHRRPRAQHVAARAVPHVRLRDGHRRRHVGHPLPGRRLRAADRGRGIDRLADPRHRHRRPGLGRHHPRGRDEARWPDPGRARAGDRRAGDAGPGARASRRDRRARRDGPRGRSPVRGRLQRGRGERAAEPGIGPGDRRLGRPAHGGLRSAAGRDAPRRDRRLRRRLPGVRRDRPRRARADPGSSGPST